MSFYMILFLCVCTVPVLSLDLGQQQKTHTDQSNVLYFEAHNDNEATQNKKDHNKVRVSDSTCPNPQFFCANNLTCCTKNSPTGPSYSCCPIPQGVCCPDGVHCCPPRFQCDMVKSQCFFRDQLGHRFVASDWSLTRSDSRESPVSPPNPAEAVVCPGGSLVCEDGSTCCPLPSGEYSCCPIPQAICCADHVHCCPNGYRCNMSAGTCFRGHKVQRWLRKVPPRQQVTEVVCKDGSKCPEGNSCCSFTAGHFGCCPREKAACCFDPTTCCPQDYQCDQSSGTCMRFTETLVWLSHHSASTQGRELSVICPGGRQQCPDGTTCCQTGPGKYGCCPSAKAVCCSDGVHCCPEGYTCDMAAGVCVRRNSAIVGLKVLAASAAATPGKASVICDSKIECPFNNTCCQLKSGPFGCCPLQQAVCCDDQIHCCPKDYQCNTTAGTCAKGAEIINWMNKTSSRTFDDNV